METGLFCAYGKKAEVPLKGVKITGKVCGFHGEIQISQVYYNDTSSSLEAVYTFPLPDQAIITDFTARMGDRKITAEVWEREKAFEIYDKAVRKGDTSFLLEEFRPNIFQVSLGQLLPGEEVEVFISYLDNVKYQDGEVRILIPTLVAPRYIPGVPSG
ncbi:MAG: VWA domain-containing protein, partial [Candidatus Syntrophonatronum acetioxidans]